MVKIPFCLTKRQGDGPTGEMRFQIEIPDQYMKQATELDLHKQKFFVLVGPVDDIADINAIVKKV